MSARDLARPLVETPIARLSSGGRESLLGSDALPWSADLERGFDYSRAEPYGVLVTGSAIPSFRQVLLSWVERTEDEPLALFVTSMVCNSSWTRR